MKTLLLTASVILAVAWSPSWKFTAYDARQDSQAKSDAGKKAVELMRKLADQIRSCDEDSNIYPTKEKNPRYFRLHWGPPTDVRFDVKASDSLVAPFEGTVEFSIYSGSSLYSPTPADAEKAPDMPVISATTRHRHFFRINDSGIELDYRNLYDNQKQAWVLEQGKPSLCWERVGYK